MSGPAFIQLHSGDNVATALRDVDGGLAPLRGPDGDRPAIVVGAPTALGHKIALRDIAAGELVVKHGEAIGRATAVIAAGEHVHVHNVVSLSREEGR